MIGFFQEQIILIKLTHNKMERISISENVDQMCKGQDYTVSGQTTIDDQQVKYAAVFDGHGKDNVIHFIRSISKTKMNEIMAASCPATAMFHYINDFTPKLCIRDESSGSTMCLARIFPTYVEIINMGDSQAVVIKNGQIEFISEPHCYENPKEQERLAETFARVYESSNIKIIDDRHLYKTRSSYIVHRLEDNSQLAVSQALGHAGKTGLAPDRTTIPFEGTDEIVIIIGSDGLFDMVHRKMENNEFVYSDLLAMKDMSGEEILKRATNRWTQEWEMHPSFEDLAYSLVESFSREEKETDDVAVIKIDIRPNES